MSVAVKPCTYMKIFLGSLKHLFARRKMLKWNTKASSALQPRKSTWEPNLNRYGACLIFSGDYKGANSAPFNTELLRTCREIYHDTNPSVTEPISICSTIRRPLRDSSGIFLTPKISIAYASSFKVPVTLLPMSTTR